MTGLQSLKVKEKGDVNKTVSKRQTTMNKLYNIPCFNGISLLSDHLIDEMTSILKSKEKEDVNKSVFNERKKQLL